MKKGRERAVFAPRYVLKFLSARLRALRLCVKQDLCGQHEASLRRGFVRSLFVLLLLIGGCQSPRQFWDSLKGEGFPEWNGKMAGGMRGKSPEAKPSGFFTD